MKEKFHKTFFLLKLLGICLIFCLIQRILFFSIFFNQFSDSGLIEICKAFLIGILTDAISCIYFLLPTWLILLFLNVENKVVKRVALIWFIFAFSVWCILNLSDIGYYPITKKRMGAEILDMLPEIPALLGSYLKDYWYLLILLFVFVAFAVWVIKKQINNYKNYPIKPHIKIINVVIVLFLFFSIMRGGYSIRPFMPFDIPSLVNPKLQWLASNTPFQFLHTLDNKNIKIENYYLEEEAEKLISFEKQFHSKEFKKKNILFIILESFCSERIGLFNPEVKAYTPFLDSLFSVSRTYKYGMANGRLTIDALPSVLAGIPSFMDKNYCYSNYSNNNVHAISYLLEQEGYHTSFFYGGLKTTFGFQNFTNINFSKNYYDQDTYDSHYENSGWGVDDHLFLPFVAEKLNTLPQPFCASLLTLSLHHPFPIPEPYKTLLDSIKDPVKKSMKYTDISLQLFFNDIKKSSWYNNSIIVICADHTSGSLGNFEGNTINEFAIPITFIASGDSAFNNPQEQSISQIDIYPTILDYLGYNKPFKSIGNSALSGQHPTIQYGGNGMFLIFDYPYQLEIDNHTQQITKFLKYNADRTVTWLAVEGNDKIKAEEMAKILKAYIQVFSYTINKNQF